MNTKKKSQTSGFVVVSWELKRVMMMARTKARAVRDAPGWAASYDLPVDVVEVKVNGKNVLVGRVTLKGSSWDFHGVEAKPTQAQIRKEFQ